MRLANSNFGVVFNASGARGFYGEGWPFHSFLKPLGLSYKGATLVTKTVTKEPLAGNLKRTWFPDCIKVYPRKQCVLNAVGLTNPGFAAWVHGEIPDVTVISLAGTAPELVAMIETLAGLKKDQWTKKQIAIQLNLSCPNVKKEPVDFAKLLSALPRDFPIIVKVGMHFPLDEVLRIQDQVACSALAISNTLPWGAPQINWQYMFGSDKSPLAKFGGGGLSGRPLFPLLIDYLSTLRAMGWEKPIVAGGGILSTQDIDNVFAHGADAIELGSVSLLKPWRVQKLVDYANKKYSDLDK